MPTVRALVDEPIATISRHIFGHFAEHLGTCIYEGLWVGEDSPIPNTEGIRTDVLEALRRIRPPVLRWPGGCFADTYDWRDGVGPSDERPRRVNVWWGGVVEPNSFGTHEFLRLCRLLDCAPYVCGNVGAGTPRELAQWIEYCNYDGDSTLAAERAANGAAEPFRVNFWGVGNENWGCGGAMDPEDYAREYRRFANYCHEFGGVPLFLIACGPNGNNVDWTRGFMDKWNRRARLHGFAAHYYCGTAGGSTEYDQDQFLLLIERAVGPMERLVLQQRAALDGYDPERRIKLIIDEWGTWHRPDPNHPAAGLWQQNTMRDALVAAGTLDIFCRHADKVYMSNIAQMVNVLQSMILTDGPRMLATPTYHVYEMYAGHQEAQSVRLVIDASDAEGEAVTFRADGREQRVDRLDGAASLRDDRLLVTLTHRHPTASAEVRVRLGGATVRAAEGRVLGGADIRSHNTFDQPQAVTPRPAGITLDGGDGVVVLPPASVAALSFELG